ncbi:MAG: YegS/Rv2252/BmrU family lipid kinase [Bacteroidales bacterium]|nr:YegS/Rv2252/BmrU family lipid kinase [Bacteroidales bacterium]
MTEKISFIVNKKNIRKCKTLEEIKKELHKNFELEFLYTESIGDGINKSKFASENGANYVIAIGGDGTINEVTNGILTSKVEKKPILGILPCGTGDDFIKSHQVKPLIESFQNLKSEEIDVLKIDFTNKNGQKNTRYSLNIGDIGVSALTVKIVNGSKKRLGSALTFFVGALKAFITYKHNTIRVTGDNFKYEGKITTVVFANGKYFGGGMCIAPNAILNDGVFDVTLVGNIKTFTFLRYSLKLRKEQELKHPQVFYYQTKNLKIENLTLQKSPIEADGEFLGYSPLEISISAQKMKILI